MSAIAPAQAGTGSRPYAGAASALAGLVALAWVALVVWTLSPAAGALDHERLEHPAPGTVLLLVGGWALMTVAMMGPATIPWLRRLGERPDPGPVPWRRLGLWLLAFLGVWLTFGVAVTSSDAVLHRAFEPPSLSAWGWVVLPATFVLAAAYQLTGWKRRALRRCQGPTATVRSAWSAGERGVAWRVGVRHGVDCVGSCAGLMLVVFAVGMTSLPAMAAGAAAAVVERRGGPRASGLVALALVAAAAVVTVRRV